MTTFLDNQIDLFDLNSAVSEPADFSSADPKTSADWIATTVQKSKSPDKTVSNSELMELVNSTTIQ